MGHHQYFSLAIRGDDHDPLGFQPHHGSPTYLEFIKDIDVHLDEVGELLGVTPEDTIVRVTWFVNTFCSQPSFSDDQLTRAFIMYILGCSILCTRRDRIHLSLLGSLRDVTRIDRND